jgi:hypothetical protein
LTSEKSIPFFGKGTKPGSEYAARACENIDRKTHVETIKAFNEPYKLEIKTLKNQFHINSIKIKPFIQ